MFNRPFDNQSQIRIRLETEAKLYIQDQIKNNILELVWSYILDFENSKNPHSERRRAIAKWRNLAIIDVIETPNVLANAKKLLSFGIKTKDALHVASAIEGKADDKLLSGIKRSNIIRALGPIDYIKVLEK
ncbi:PIN domain protein [Candidatus Marithrix sp. Canyon 246]|uniref:PIN domain protein n=1 Tax=Candidatus Marithrix sp. Canyon 246 TaxID=1827136 RepID=UPI00209B7215|nr:PIN domain protein [Candidatus Marithrix sp. Canyon 246]